MLTKHIELIGWNAERIAEFSRVVAEKKVSEEERRGFLPGRVIGVHHDFFETQTSDRTMLCTPSGRFRQSAEQWPVVGDWVVITPLDEENGVINDLLERRSILTRLHSGGVTAGQAIAANVDYIFIVSGLDRDFNLRRIERYLTLGWNSGAIPILILNKADLAEDPDTYLDQVRAAAPGNDLFLTSALNGEGIEAIRSCLQPNNTGLLVGSSGSGKSTLTNRLLDRDVQKVTEVREGDQRGRHTTTTRTLFVLPGGGALIDTPGLREVGLWGDSTGVDESFAEIAELTAACRFSDCSHQHEPGCAVLTAVNAGEITRERYEAYMKQRRELDFLADKQEALRRKDEWHKQISKEIRRFYKNR